MFTDRNVMMCACEGDAVASVSVGVCVQVLGVCMNVCERLDRWAAVFGQLTVECDR